MSNNLLAVILGGGQGSRLSPLTKSRSKPAVPIGGKYRLVDIPISNCLHSNIRRIFVLTQFNSASLNRHIKNTYNFDAFSRGFVDILAAEQTPNSQTWFQGTADAVRQSLHHLSNHEFEHVLVLSGDQLYQMDFNEMFEKHLATDADLSIATIPVDANDATSFGIMKTDQSEKIVSFIEKPSIDILDDWKSDVNEELRWQGRHFMASMGIYLFKKEVLFSLFENNPDATDFGKEIIPKALSSDLPVYSYTYDGYWEDIGTITSFFESNLELADSLPRFNLYDNDRLVFTRARLLPASKLSGTTLEKTIVAEGCIIEASRIERTVVGIRSRIGKGSTIVESIVMGNDFYQHENVEFSNENPKMGIGERCYIQKAIIDKNVRIGNDVRINGGAHLENGEFATHTVVDGIVVVPKGTVIPSGTVI